MLQDIIPHQFDNNFKIKEPQDNDLLFIFNDNKLLVEGSSNELKFTTVEKIKELNSELVKNAIYLFSIDDSPIFCAFGSIEETETLKYIKPFEVREKFPKLQMFIVATVSHLANWYSTNKFCGRCAEPMEFSKTERALCCPKCGLTKYPNISPAVIVGIIDKDKILLTRYSDRPYKKLSLVAGFMEIGETLEDTIKREVMEEVGLKVKNFRYYKSQPWAFSQSVLMGFFVELDGDSTVKIDKTELSEATWYSREEIPPMESTISITNEMIDAFKKEDRYTSLYF